MSQYQQQNPDGLTPEEMEHAEKWRRTWPWIAVGVVALGLGVFVVFFLMHDQDDVVPLPAPGTAYSTPVVTAVPVTPSDLPSATVTRTVAPSTPTTPSSEPTASSFEDPTTEPSEDSSDEPSTAPSDEPDATPSSDPEQPVAGTTIDKEGVYEIGVDAKPGRYETTVPGHNDDGCFWSISKDATGDQDSVQQSKSLDGGARGTVTLREGDYFQSEGCGTWHLR